MLRPYVILSLVYWLVKGAGMVEINDVNATNETMKFEWNWTTQSPIVGANEEVAEDEDTGLTYLDENYGPGMKAFIATGCTIGMILNIGVLLIIALNKSLHKPCYYFIANLAFSDTCCCFLFILSDVALTDVEAPASKAAGALFCALWESEYLIWLTIFLTPLTICASVIERYFAVAHLTLYAKYFKNKQAIIIIILWFIGVLFSIDDLINFPFDADERECVPGDEAIGFEYFWVVYQYYVPLVIMTIFNYLTYSTLRKNSASSNAGGSQGKAAKKLLKLMLFVSVSYAVFYSGQGIVFLIYLLGGIEENFYWDQIDPVANVMVLMNGWTNPVLYYVVNEAFRLGTQRLLRCKTKGTEVEPTVMETKVN